MSYYFLLYQMIVAKQNKKKIYGNRAKSKTSVQRRIILSFHVIP